MATYLDTNVILTRYVPSDPNSQAVDSFFNKSREARYCSEISVLELYCVFSRLIRADMIKALERITDFENLATDEKTKVTVEHAIRTWRVRVVGTERSVVKLPVGRQMLEIGHELFEAIRVSSKLGLKTLDTLHLAYASTISELDPDLTTFTTVDKEIISRGKEIENEIGIKVLEPAAEG
jgi:predicted nucleic acid-binding protein